jgi:hypothetical protein
VTITAGDEVTVTANVTNDGLGTATKTVEFRVGGTVVDSTTVQLNDSETKQVELTATSDQTSGLTAGDFTHGVFTPDDSETATLTVESSSNSVSEQFGGENNVIDENGEVLAVISAFNQPDSELDNGDVLTAISEFNSNSGN